jgi:hypothetical protein
MRGAFHDQFANDIEYGSEGKQMVKHVHIGDNVMVKCQIDIDENY